ncbi:MAG: helix-turn-helix domain-containing protein [Pseudobdellovibrionaceae bacterium]
MSKKIEILPPLPKRLKEARVKLGISQKTLGILAGIDEFSASARMNQYEKGKHAPDYAMAKCLAAVLKVPCSYLYEEDDDIAAMLVVYYNLNKSDREQIIDKIISTQQKNKH